MSAGGNSFIDRSVLVTGIADEASLALPIASALQHAGASIVCAGLGPTPHQRAVSEAAQLHLSAAHETFQKTVAAALGPATPALVLDASLDASIADLARVLREQGVRLGGLVHAIAFDRTIRRGEAKPLLAVTREEFLDCMSVSAYSLLALVRALLVEGVLQPGAGIVALSYLGAERVMFHPYRNVGVAKAALERIALELAAELGRSHGIRVNVVRFSPWSKSRAGGAIPGLDAAVERCGEAAPLGNASPEALAREVVHLLEPGLGITGEVRHVDGGYHALG
jgi:enoyl-[acyl-carrier protein] reductase I